MGFALIQFVCLGTSIWIIARLVGFSTMISGVIAAAMLRGSTSPVIGSAWTHVHSASLADDGLNSQNGVVTTQGTTASYFTAAHDIPANGPREHYMRAQDTAEGLHVFSRQDSALLSVLSEANALAVRPPRDPARKAGDALEIIRL